MSFFLRVLSFTRLFLLLLLLFLLLLLLLLLLLMLLLLVLLLLFLNHDSQKPNVWCFFNMLFTNLNFHIPCVWFIWYNFQFFVLPQNSDCCCCFFPLNFIHFWLVDWLIIFCASLILHISTHRTDKRYFFFWFTRNRTQKFTHKKEEERRTQQRKRFLLLV